MKRSRLARRALQRAFGIRGFQNHFARKHFLRPLDELDRSWFFEGYRKCPAFSSFFGWFTPTWLRVLERDLIGHPERLGDITVWLGGRDQVVNRAELDATERALGVRWPVVLFPEWGHYPMLDVPEEWAKALRDALADS
jgi:pimeloyl-ACP methyl ester carboxylesterase